MRYALFKASGFSATHARKQFGFQNISKQVKDVEDVLKQCQFIRNSIDKLVSIQERSLLISLGIPVQSDSEESDDESSDDLSDNDCVPDSDVSHSGDDQTLPSLLEIVKKSNFNWFQIMEDMTVQHGKEVVTEQLYNKMELLDLSSKERQLLSVSYEAFTASEQCEQDQNRVADSLNGYIVGGSAEEAPNFDIPKAASPIDPCLHKVILNRRSSIRRKARRDKAKRIAQANLLGRKKK